MYPLRFVCDIPTWVHSGNPQEPPQQRTTRLFFTPKNTPPWLKNTTIFNPNTYQTPSNFQLPLYGQCPMYIQRMPDYQSPHQTFMNVPPGNGQFTNIQGNVDHVNNQVMPMRNQNAGQINNQMVSRRRPKVEQTNDQAIPMRRPNVGQIIPKRYIATAADKSGRQMLENIVAKVDNSNKNMSYIQEGLSLKNNVATNTTNETTDEYIKCNITVTPGPNIAIMDKAKTNNSASLVAELSVTPIESNVPSPTKQPSVTTQTDFVEKATTEIQHRENKACNDFNTMPMLPVAQQNNETCLPRAIVIGTKSSAATILQGMPNDNQFLRPPSESNIKTNKIDALPPNINASIPLDSHTVNNIATSPYLSDCKSDVVNTANNSKNCTNEDNQTVVRHKRKIESTITENNDPRKEDLKIAKPDNFTNCTTTNSKAITSDVIGTCNNGTVEKKRTKSDNPQRVSLNDKIQNLLRKYVEDSQNLSKSVETTISKDNGGVKDVAKKLVIETRSQTRLRNLDVVKKSRTTETRLDLDKKLPEIKKESTILLPEIKPEKEIKEEENDRRLPEVKREVDNEMKPLKGKIDIKREEVPVVLTHIVDGYIIQESNVAFAIRKPLKEKNISDRVLRGQMNEKSEQRREDIVKKSIAEKTDEKPFANLNRSEVQKWSIDQLSHYLSKYNWRETMYAFRTQEVDGEALLLATKENLLDIGVEESHAAIISSFIEN